MQRRLFVSRSGLGFTAIDGEKDRDVNSRTAAADVRFSAHNGLKSDIAPCPKSTNNGHAS
jgi:hypothetical protein